MQVTQILGDLDDLGACLVRLERLILVVEKEISDHEMSIPSY